MIKKLFILPILFFSILSAEVDEYAQQASTRPIAFSVVREDSIQDLEIIKRYYSEEKVSMLMVASGGCTAAELIANAPIHDLTLVDPNPAQLAISKIKIALLSFPTQERLEFLGYRPMEPSQRKYIMQGLMVLLGIDQHVFGNIDEVVNEGLDFSGRYEKVFEELRNNLKPFKSDIEKLFTLTDVKEQIKRVDPTTPFGQALDNAFDQVMSQDNLVMLFGEKATANRVQDFSRHFTERTRIYLSNHLASESPWLAHLLLGRMDENEMLPWLNSTLNQPLPAISYVQGSMNTALEQCERESYHIIHLSNILDWLSPAEAEKTLSLAFDALKPGGVVVIRQLNSSIDIPSMGKKYEWDLNTSREFLQEDRSFFYRNFYLGFKPRVSPAPNVKALADSILENEIPVIKGPFFQALPVMTKEQFQTTQIQFFFAVNYYSRPMGALIARLPLHKDRVDIIHNIVEEHGDFDSERYHANTFKKFLNSIGIENRYVDLASPSPSVNAFNFVLMGACANEDPIIGIAANGIIEYAFADISAFIGKTVVERGWVKKEDLIHYNLHASIDKRHAEEFFKIIEPYYNDPKQREKIIVGLRLGAHIFNSMYDDLYAEALLSDDICR